MRTTKEDIALIREAGWFKGRRDPLFNAVGLLCMYAKGRHKPLRNLHKLADAIERGDADKSEKVYKRLVQEVEWTLPKYPDIQSTVATMSDMTDEDFAEIEQLMREYE